MNNEQTDAGTVMVGGRAEFEAAFQSLTPRVPCDFRRYEDTGSYKNDAVFHAHRGWQAAYVELQQARATIARLQAPLTEDECYLMHTEFYECSGSAYDAMQAAHAALLQSRSAKTGG